MKNLFDLSGKVAVVTGSSRGIGRAIVEHMSAAGARVVVSSRSPDMCESVATEIRGRGGEALAIPAKISDKAQLQQLVNKTIEHWGRIDILVCNAASNPYLGPIGGLTDEVFDRMMRNNVLSNLWLTQMAVPGMIERRDGVIVFISSIVGIRATLHLGAYGISKAADMALSRNLAAEYGKHNIRVNTIAPGLVRTDFARALWENPDALQKREAATPLGRIGEVDDIAGIAVFLAAPAGAFVTGQTIIADGGIMIAP
jgi:NAD(P)-dependent dehydrogenase (short-subunit alcohol dehydrogenase family)